MTEITGGCQCGRVRYAVTGELYSEFCHCGMCRRASGGAFAALANVAKADFRWTAGQPKAFASSTAAQRTFCGDCGTPLTFDYTTSQSMDVSIGSLDDPAAVGPLQLEFSVEHRLPWLVPIEGAKQQRLDEYADAPPHKPGFRSLQHQPS